MSDTNLDKVIDVDSLLDGTLDDLADLPEFKNYPVGTHKVKISWTMNKEVEWSGKKKKVQEMKCEGIETMELATQTDEPITAGQIQNFTFDLTNEWAQGTFKMIMAALAEHFGKKTPRELMTESNGCEVAIVVTHRKRKDDPTKMNVQLENLVVA